MLDCNFTSLNRWRLRTSFSSPLLVHMCSPLLAQTIFVPVTNTQVNFIGLNSWQMRHGVVWRPLGLFCCFWLSAPSGFRCACGRGRPWSAEGLHRRAGVATAFLGAASVTCESLMNYTIDCSAVHLEDKLINKYHCLITIRSPLPPLMFRQP